MWRESHPSLKHPILHHNQADISDLVVVHAA